MRSQLNVVALEDVFEDEGSVHVVMELCKGGELLHNLGKRHYSEGTVRANPVEE
jgi:calcium-dependent protein kinase